MMATGVMAISHATVMMRHQSMTRLVVTAATLKQDMVRPVRAVNRGEKAAEPSKEVVRSNAIESIFDIAS